MHLKGVAKRTTIGLHAELMEAYKCNGPGLVRFNTPKNFHRINKKGDPLATSAGAWYFPDDDADCSPEFWYENITEDSAEKDRLLAAFVETMDTRTREQKQSEMDARLEKVFEM